MNQNEAPTFIDDDDFLELPQKITVVNSLNLFPPKEGEHHDQEFFRQVAQDESRAQVIEALAKKEG